jgi:hypothetical protein
VSGTHNAGSAATGEVLDQWGYRSVLTAQHRVGGVFSQVMLINRSPQLNDLDSEAFARLREHPAINAHQGEWLFALQRAAAAPGSCDRPVGTGHERMHVIEGAAATDH